MTKEKRLTKSQLKDWRIASNRVSVESIRYAAKIVGYTNLVTETITTLENLIAGHASAADCRVLYQKAAKSTFRAEPLLHSILIALKWAASDGNGEFMVGNIVDPIYAARFEAANPDEETYRKLAELRDSILGPYYEHWDADLPRRVTG